MRQPALGQVALLALATVSPADASGHLHAVTPREDHQHIKAISDFVDSRADDLRNISKTLHDNPELAYREFEAHELLTSFMESHDGWNVSRAIYGIETAFTAVYEGEGEGPVVSFNAEYDALPGLGHACGHNLIATVAVTGALATANIMKTEKLGGKVILFGTPAEESGGGKIKMLEAGVFKDHKIDISLIAHPGLQDTAYMITSSNERFDVEYIGKAAHAAASPWEGINAQDAMVLAYDAIALLRQQSQATDQVHFMITEGGQAVNVIPSSATAAFQVRARDDLELKPWTERVLKCFEAGAVGTGAELNLTMRPYGYSNMVSNEVLVGSFYRSFQEVIGNNSALPDRKIDKLRAPSASTDQGNIAWEFPSIQPGFAIYNENGTLPASGPHTAPFEVAAGSKRSFLKALEVGKALAGVAVDALTTKGMVDEAWKEIKALPPRNGTSSSSKRHHHL